LQRKREREQQERKRKQSLEQHQRQREHPPSREVATEATKFTLSSGAETALLNETRPKSAYTTSSRARSISGSSRPRTGIQSMSQLVADRRKPATEKLKLDSALEPENQSSIVDSKPKAALSSCQWSAGDLYSSDEDVASFEKRSKATSIQQESEVPSRPWSSSSSSSTSGKLTI
jgi:hypothetical protein